MQKYMKQRKYKTENYVCFEKTNKILLCKFLKRKNAITVQPGVTKNSK